MSSSEATPESWIASFCAVLGHEFFAEVSEEFIEDDFNLTGLQSQVVMYKEALEMILDVDVEDEDEDEEDEEDEEDDDEALAGAPRHPRRHTRTPSDVSLIESSAETLYGLIHQRFICSRAGIQQMSEKYEMAHFGVCPRYACHQTRTLPVGLSDLPGDETVKLFCPSCLDVYVPANSRFQNVDGAFFGRTFGALFLLTFPEYDYSKHGAEAVVTATGGSLSDATAILNGMQTRNIAPGLGWRATGGDGTGSAGKDAQRVTPKYYVPRIYGFKVSEFARAGPRMTWLRDKPVDLNELDEAKTYAEEAPGTDDELADRCLIPYGNSLVRVRPPGRGRSDEDRQVLDSSDMAVDTNGAATEL